MTFTGNTSPPLEGCPKGGVVHAFARNKAISLIRAYFNDMPDEIASFLAMTPLLQ